MSVLALTPADVRSVEPRFDRLIEAEVRAVAGDIVLGWHSSAMDHTGAVCLGGGVAKDRETARRIALAETVERATFRGLLKSSERVQYGLDRSPTSCGFAAGFDFEKTRLRSICEAVERWARALWIDEGLALSQVPKHRTALSALGEYFLTSFEDVLIYSRSITVPDPIRTQPLSLKLGVVVGLTETGAFPGSRVCADSESPYEHAALEAWRHHSIFEKNMLPDLPENSFLRRIGQFGTRRDDAVRQIEKAKTVEWPVPQIVIHRGKESIAGKAFIWRSLCDGYQGWEKGPLDRFVY